METIVIVGTGFGGISAALALKKKGITDFIMLERRGFAGGTWLQNTYPGAAVDVQSPLYSLAGISFPWSHLFAKQSEIADYTKKTIEDHGLEGHIRLNCELKSAQWQDDSWLLTLSSGEEIHSRMVINATGPLSTPVVPKFNGLDCFNGESFHCNDWRHDVSLEGKSVAIVGSGASAIQIIPAIVDKVKTLHVLQRTPHWILPRLDWAFPKWLRKVLAIKPIYSIIRWVIYWALELRVIAFKYSNTALMWLADKPARKHLKKQIEDPLLREELTPDFTIGCKRILVSNTYYPAIQKQNTILHNKHDGIIRFTERGIEFAETGETQIDVVVFATGYNAIDAMVSYSVTGLDGIKLADQWRDYPRAYMGTTVPSFPNFFVITGPNTGIGHTSAIFVIESQLKYVMHCINELTTNGAKSIAPTIEAEKEYTEVVHKEMEKTVWVTGGCSSWYQNAQGKVIAMFPGFSFSFRRLCNRFKLKDHIITHKEG